MGPNEKPLTVGDIRRAIDGVPDEVVAFLCEKNYPYAQLIECRFDKNEDGPLGCFWFRVDPTSDVGLAVCRNPIDPYELDEFTRQYLETALWSSTDDQWEPLDRGYDIDDCSQELLRDSVADCLAFQREHWRDIQDAPGRAGHDFWLTRNRHGAGFWDGDWPKNVGRKLTEASHVYGSVDLYVGDDEKIYRN